MMPLQAGRKKRKRHANNKADPYQGMTAEERDAAIAKAAADPQSVVGPLSFDLPEEINIDIPARPADLAAGPGPPGPPGQLEIPSGIGPVLTAEDRTKAGIKDPFEASVVKERREAIYGDPEKDDLAKRAEEQALGLGFDVEAEREARRTGIERTTQQQYERLGRVFGLDPSGLQQGRAIRIAGTVGAAEMTALEALESELSQRSGPEARANLAAVQGLLAQQQQAGLSAQQLSMAGEAQEQQFLSDQQRLAVEQAALTGRIGNIQTEAARAVRAQEGLMGRELSQQERAAVAQEVIQTTNLAIQQRGSIAGEELASRELTERERAAGAAETQVERRQTEVERAALEAETQVDRRQTEVERSAEEREKFQDTVETHRERVELAGLVGFIDGFDTLSKQALELQGREQTEEERQARVSERLTEAGLSGLLPGDELTNTEMQAQLGITGATFAEGVRAAREQGFEYDAQTKTFRKKQKMTLAGTEAAFARTLRQAQITGTYEDPENPGTDFLTLAAQELAFREGVATGQINVDRYDKFGKRIVEKEDTLEYKRTEMAVRATELEEDIRRGAFALQADAQRFGQSVTEADLTGVFVKSGMDISELQNFADAYGASSAEDADIVDEETGEIIGKGRYDGKWDLNDDGVIDFTDFNELSAVAGGGVATTLAGQKFAIAKGQVDFAKQIEKSRITGQFEDEDTVQEAQRLYNNRITDTQIWGGPAPITTDMQTFGTLTDYNNADIFQEKLKGDPAYRQDFDLNDDGVLNNDDFLVMTQWKREGRIDFISGDGSQPDDVFIIAPPGPQTMAARTLGLEERKLTEAALQFDDTFAENRRIWDSEFGGVLFDDDGNAVTIFDPTVKGTGTVLSPDGAHVPVTSLQRQALEERKREFDKKMDVDMEQFFESLGWSRDELALKIKNAQSLQETQAWTSILSAGIQAWGASRQGADPVSFTFGGGGGGGGRTGFSVGAGSTSSTQGIHGQRDPRNPGGGIVSAVVDTGKDIIGSAWDWLRRG